MRKITNPCTKKNIWSNDLVIFADTEGVIFVYIIVIPVSSGPSNDYFIKVWFQLSNWFQIRRFLCEFPIRSYVKLSSAVGAILVKGPNRRTHNLLLRNHWANCNQTLVELSLDGPLPKLCPVILTSNQDGHQAKNRKKQDKFSSYWANGFRQEDFYGNFP
jgi:hypothetical protein